MGSYSTRSPYGLHGEGPYYDTASPSPTPSPRYHYMQSPQRSSSQRQGPIPRPSTALPRGMAGHPGHSRGFSQDYGFSSPRYDSRGHYATANVSDSRAARKDSSSSSYPKYHRRRHSYSQRERVYDSPGESDEDEFIEIDGITYMIPARSRSRRYDSYYTVNAGRVRTNHHDYVQGGRLPYEKEAGYSSPMYRDPQPYEPVPRPSTRTRRSSTSVPQRPATVAPQAAARKKTRKPPQEPSPLRNATEVDAKKHGIPAGYSLKHWDPSEEPIVLLGSVFDANTLGKWIFDWTVCEQGGAGGTPISNIAGQLWLLLISVYGKIKRSDECIKQIRDKDKRDIVIDFIDSGERLTERFGKLLKSCEKPMLRSSKGRSSQLGSNAGIEFVKTLFGVEREMDQTEKWMASAQLWETRFIANVEEILANPTE